MDLCRNSSSYQIQCLIDYSNSAKWLNFAESTLHCLWIVWVKQVKPMFNRILRRIKILSFHKKELTERIKIKCNLYSIVNTRKWSWAILFSMNIQLDSFTPHIHDILTGCKALTFYYSTLYNQLRRSYFSLFSSQTILPKNCDGIRYYDIRYLTMSWVVIR